MCILHIDVGIGRHVCVHFFFHFGMVCLFVWPEWRSMRLRQNAIKLNHVWWIFYASPLHRQSVQNVIEENERVQTMLRAAHARMVRVLDNGHAQCTCGEWPLATWNTIQIATTVPHVQRTKSNPLNIANVQKWIEPLLFAGVHCSTCTTSNE